MRKVETIFFGCNREPQKLIVNDELRIWQDLVDGYIEIFPLAEDIILIVNENGKNMGLPINYCAKTEWGVEYFAGNVIMLSENEEGEFVSITDEQAKRGLEKMFEVERRN